MAARRRASATRKGKKGNQQQVLIVVGAIAGALLIAGGAYWLGHHNAQRPVVARSAPVTKPPPVPAAPATPSPKPAATTRPTKPHFDFYTILPDVETVLPDKEPTRRAAATPGKPAKTEGGAGYVLQAASYGSYSEADRLKAKLVLSGFEARIEKVTLEGKGDFYRVRLGPYATVQELDAVDKRLAQQLGIHPLRLKLKRPEA